MNTRDRKAILKVVYISDDSEDKIMAFKNTSFVFPFKSVTSVDKTQQTFKLYSETIFCTINFFLTFH